MDSSNAKNQTAGGEARAARGQRPVPGGGQSAGFVEGTRARDTEMQARMRAERATWDAELQAQILEMADVQAPINDTWRPTKLTEDGRRQGDGGSLAREVEGPRKPGAAMQGGQETGSVGGTEAPTALAGAPPPRTEHYNSPEGIAAAARKPIGQTELGKSTWADEGVSQSVPAAAGFSAAAAADVPRGPAVKNELWKSRWAGQEPGLEAARAGGGASAAAATAAPRSATKRKGASRPSFEEVRQQEESKRVRAAKMEKKTAKGGEKVGRRDEHAAVLEKCYVPPAVDARKTMWGTLRPMAIIGKGNGMAKVGYWEVCVGRDWPFSRTDYEDMVVYTMLRYLHPLLHLYLQPPKVEGRNVPVQSLILGLKDYNAELPVNRTWKTELIKAWGVMLDWATVMARLSSGAMDAEQWPLKRQTLYGIFTMAFEAEMALSMSLAPSEGTLGLVAVDEQDVPTSVNTPCPKGISAEIKHWTEPLWKEDLRRTILRLWAWSESSMEHTSPALWRLDSRARRVFALRLLEESRDDEEEKKYVNDVVRHDRGPLMPVLVAGSVTMPSLYAGLFDEDELAEVLGENEGH